MPLSDHEKRLLDEIEQTLRTDDPDLASSMRAARPLPRLRLLVLLAVACLIVGVGLLVSALQLSGVGLAVLGVVGYLLIVTSVECAVRVAIRIRDDRGPRSSRHPKRA